MAAQYRRPNSREFAANVLTAFVLAWTLAHSRAALAETLVGGVIDGDTHWTVAGSPYIVTSSVYVFRGSIYSGPPATLTIDPGVEVRFAAGTTLSFGNFYGCCYPQPGALNAQGTAAQPIRFTSNALAPQRGDWAGVYFSDLTDDATTHVDHCIIEYGGASGGAALSVDAAAPVIGNTIVRFSAGDGLRVSSGLGPVVTGCTFSDNDSSGVNITDGGPLPTITGCTLSNNGKFALSAAPQTVSLLAGLGGAGNARIGIELRGGSINRSSQWPATGLPYAVTSDVTIHSAYGVSGPPPVLTIDPAVEVLFAPGTRLVVGNFYGCCYPQLGALDARGTPGQPIRFTSGAAAPQRGDWKGILFTDWTDDGATWMEHCVVEYGGQVGGGGLQVDAAAPSITSTTVRLSGSDGLRVSSGLGPLVTGCTFSDNDSSGVNIADGGPLPTITGCTLSNNGKFALSAAPQTVSLLAGLGGAGNARTGIELRGGLVGRDTRWPVAGMPYIVTGDISIHCESIYTQETAHLALGPGTEVRFERGTGLGVGSLWVGLYPQPGAIDARGTADSAVVLTSNAATPMPGDWNGLSLSPWTTALDTRLAGVRVHYAGGGPAQSALRIEGVVPRRIERCEFRKSAAWGVVCANAPALLRYCDFSANVAGGISNVAGSPNVTAAHCWWDSPAGPDTAGPGTAQQVQGAVNVSPWLGAPMWAGDSLRILRITPAAGGDNGNVTVALAGTGFVPGASLTLLRDGFASIEAESVTVTAGGWMIVATLPLAGRARGTYDVRVLNGDGQLAVMPSGFEIVAGTQPTVTLQVLGRPAILAGRARDYQVWFRNQGNVDASGTVIFIQGIPLSFIWSISAIFDAPPKPPVFEPPTWDGVPHIWPSPDGQTIGLVVPRIPPGATGVVTVSVRPTTGEPFTLTAFTSALLDPNNQPLLKCIETAAWTVLDCLVPEASWLKAAPCLNAIAQTAYGVYRTGTGASDLLGGETAVRDALHAGSFFYGVVGAVSDALKTSQACFGTPSGAFLKTKLIPGVACGLGILDTALECREPVRAFLAKLGPIVTVSAWDPNDLLGPVGFGEEHWVPAEGTMSYQVRFENLAAATAPAHAISITHVMDTTLVDPATVTFQTIRLGAFAFSPSSGARHVFHERDLRPEVQALMRLEAWLDTEAHSLEWRITAFDPLTGDSLDDPFIGILPPNTTPPEGEGSVSFTVRLRPGIPNGTTVPGAASITFDANAPIQTPEWVNRVDANVPMSRVATLPPRSDSVSFQVSWSGTDSESGVRHHDVYVSEPNAPYRLWLQGTADTAATYHGEAGHRYWFYSIAQDSAGNVESAPDAADAMILVGGTTVSVDDRGVLPSATVTAAGVSLRWVKPGGFTVPVWVGRRTAGSEWISLGMAQPASDAVSYADTHVTPGCEYEYGLSFVSGGQAARFGVLRVQLGRPAVLALRSVRALASTGELAIRFELPEPAQGDIGIFDIAGRRVWSNAIGGLAAGEHTIHARMAEGQGSGIYWVVLRQRGERRTARVVVVR